MQKQKASSAFPDSGFPSSYDARGSITSRSKWTAGGEFTQRTEQAQHSVVNNADEFIMNTSRDP